MEAAGNYTLAISGTRKDGKQANIIVNAMYRGYSSFLVVSQAFLMPHVRHMHLVLHIKANLKGSATHIWS